MAMVFDNRIFTGICGVCGARVYKTGEIERECCGIHIFGYGSIMVYNDFWDCIVYYQNENQILQAEKDKEV